MVKSMRGERWAFRLSLVPLILLGFMGIGLASQDNPLGMFVLVGIGFLGTWLSYEILCPILSLFLKDAGNQDNRKHRSPKTAHYWVTRLSLVPLMFALLVGVLLAIKGHPEDLVVLLGLGLLFSGMTYLVIGFITSLVIGEFIWGGQGGPGVYVGAVRPYDLNGMDSLDPTNLSGTTNPESPMNPWGFAYGDDRFGSDW